MQQPFAGQAGRPPLDPPSIVPTGMDVPYPEAPESLGDAGREAWGRLWTTGRAHLSNEAHFDLLKMLCEVIDRRETFAAVARKARPTTKGSMGQIRVNPIFDALQKTEAQIADLLKRAGFEPGEQKRKAAEPRKRDRLADLQRQAGAR